MAAISAEIEKEKKKSYSVYKYIPTNNTFFDKKNKKRIRYAYSLNCQHFLEMSEVLGNHLILVDLSYLIKLINKI